MGWRNLTILNSVWKWKVARSRLIIKNPFTNKTKIVDLCDFYNTDQYSIERAQDKKYLHLVPSEICDYIERTENKLV